MKNLKLYLGLIIIVCFAFYVSCKKECVSKPTLGLATVTTTSVTNITYNTATSGGNITNDGGSPITARGVCWSTSENPTTSDNKTSDGTGSGAFTSSITGLSGNISCHVRAYATNSAGTAYGSQNNFTTFTTPIGYWKLDEGSGILTADASGNQRNGTLLAAPNGSKPSWVNDGISDKALHFSGSGYIDLANTASLNFISSPFTIAAWVRYGDVGSGEFMIVGKHVSGISGGYFLVIGRNSDPYGNANKLDFYFGSDNARVLTSTPYNDNNWHFVVGAYDGSRGKLYVDGKYIGSNAANPGANNVNILIGGVFSNTGFSHGFIGDIDEVSIYNTALSDTEISKLYSTLHK